MDKPVVMHMEYPRKKPNRLPDYDYSQNGAYFITICTKDRKHLLSRISVGTSIVSSPTWFTSCITTWFTLFHFLGHQISGRFSAR